MLFIKNYVSLLFENLEKIQIKVESRLHCIGIYDDTIIKRLTVYQPILCPTYAPFPQFSV